MVENYIIGKYYPGKGFYHKGAYHEVIIHIYLAERISYLYYRRKTILPNRIKRHHLSVR